MKIHCILLTYIGTYTIPYENTLYLGYQMHYIWFICTGMRALAYEKYTVSYTGIYAVVNVHENRL